MTLSFTITKQRLLIGIAILCLLLGGFSAYRHYHHKPTPKEQVMALKKAVAKLAILPTGEDPGLAEVTDAEKLKSEPFFVDAKTGDRVLIYSKSGKSFLYRPSEKKLVNIGSIQVNPYGISQDKFSVSIRNGTDSAGLTDKVKAGLLSAFPKAGPVESQEPQRHNYPTTIVINVKGDEKTGAVVSKVAQAIGADVGIMPTGEAKPSSDVLIIIGLDAK